jgi:hypothetical protein
MQIALILWFTLFPFIMLYGAYEGPKVFWLWLGGFVLSVVWAVRIILIRPLPISKSGRWFLLWLFVLGVAGVAGIHPIDSLVGGNYRHQGLLFFFTLFLAGETIRQLTDSHRRMLHTLIGFGIVVETVIVLQQKIFDLIHPPLGTLGEPNAVAGFLAVGLIWIATLPHVKVWLRKVLYFLTLIAIVVTDSKTGMAAALFISIGLGIQALLKVSNRTIRLLLTGMGIVFVAISCMYLYSLIQKANPAPPFENRAVYWKLGIGEFAKRPLLGYGLESTDVLYENAFKAIGVDFYQLMIDRSRNIVLDIVLWSGVIGLVAFGLWIYQSVRRVAGINKYYIFIGLSAWMVFAFFQPIGVVHWILLILLFRL